MPNYDFRCERCHSVVEMFLLAGATDTPMCTTCNQTMTKVYTPPTVIFKGGDWGGSK